MRVNVWKLSKRIPTKRQFKRRKERNIHRCNGGWSNLRIFEDAIRNGRCMYIACLECGATVEGFISSATLTRITSERYLKANREMAMSIGKAAGKSHIRGMNIEVTHKN